MLKRLADQESLDASDRQLSELFSSAPPFEDDPFRKRRVWVRLERGFKRPARAGRFWVRPIVIAALLISGTAAAELGHRYVLHGSGFLGLVGAPSATSSTVVPTPRSANAKPVVRAPLAANEVAPAPSGAAVEPAPAESAPAERASAEPTANVRSTPKNSRSRPEAGEDATRVVEAIQALRTERNPARAQALLNDYLKQSPRGTLSGDALALSIEAASAQHDPRAAEYARRYLASYPKGKYRELAKRALEVQR
jgi:TolA-binding protein